MALCIFHLRVMNCSLHKVPSFNFVQRNFLIDNFHFNQKWMELLPLKWTICVFTRNFINFDLYSARASSKVLLRLQKAELRAQGRQLPCTHCASLHSPLKMRPFAFVNPHVGGWGKASWEGDRMECVDTDFIVGVSLDESGSWNLLLEGPGASWQCDSSLWLLCAGKVTFSGHCCPSSLSLQSPDASLGWVWWTGQWHNCLGRSTHSPLWDRARRHVGNIPSGFGDWGQRAGQQAVFWRPAHACLITGFAFIASRWLVWTL